MIHPRSIMIDPDRRKLENEADGEALFVSGAPDPGLKPEPRLGPG
jgi:hypothetical protein